MLNQAFVLANPTYEQNYINRAVTFIIYHSSFEALQSEGYSWCQL